MAEAGECDHYFGDIELGASDHYYFHVCVMPVLEQLGVLHVFLDVDIWIWIFPAHGYLHFGESPTESICGCWDSQRRVCRMKGLAQEPRNWTGWDACGFGSNPFKRSSRPECTNFIGS